VPVAAPEPAAVSRVAVIDPGVHELLIRLEVTDRMVGRPDYTDEFEQTRSLPTLGTGLAPNYEQIVRTAPDLILTTHASRGTVLENLNKVGPTESLPWHSADEVVQSISTVGTLLGMSEQADALSAQMAREMAPQVGPDAPRVLVLLSAPSVTDTELWVIKPGSLHGAALQAAGGRHALTDEMVGPPTLSIEGLLKIDPDMILVMIAQTSVSEAALAEHRQFWARFPMLSAVKTNSVGFMVGRTHFYTGPGVMDFKAALKEKIVEVGAR
jgi:iron complex transport system substrate-binding protein